MKQVVHLWVILNIVCGFAGMFGYMITKGKAKHEPFNTPIQYIFPGFDISISLCGFLFKEIEK